MAEATNFGMMEGAYFVGRKEILEWINTTLQLSLTKVEQTASGAVAIQLLDMMYPGRVPMSKVNWEAKNDYEFINNYKVLQKCFDRIGIDKHVDVDKLIRAKYQDNLEFMQWFKRFWEHRVGGGDAEAAAARRAYDPAAARARGRGGTKAAANLSAVARAPARVRTAGGAGAAAAAAPPAPAPAAPAPAAPAPPAAAAAAAAGEGERKNSGGGGGGGRARTSSSASAGTCGGSGGGGGAPAAAGGEREEGAGGAAARDGGDGGGAADLELAALRTEAEALESERDFYFEKLVDIETYIQGIQDNMTEEISKEEMLKNIFEILYASRGEGGDGGPGPGLAVTGRGEVVRGAAAAAFRRALAELDAAHPPPMTAGAPPADADADAAAAAAAGEEKGASVPTDGTTAVQAKGLKLKEGSEDAAAGEEEEERDGPMGKENAKPLVEGSVVPAAESSATKPTLLEAGEQQQPAVGSMVQAL